MTDNAPFPNIRAALIELLADLGTGGVRTPADLAGACPFILIRRNGGSDDRITDSAHIDIDVFAIQPSDAETLAEDVRQRLIAGPHSLTNCVIDRADCTFGPTAVPWSNTNVSLVTASYLVTARRSFSLV